MERKRKDISEGGVIMASRDYPVIDLEATGKNLRRIRKKMGIKVKEVREMCLLNSTQAIYQWERGCSLPRVENLVILSRMYGVPIEELLVIEEVNAI